MGTVVNPITGFEVTLLPARVKAPELFGWVRLVNGKASAGYIYIQPEPEKPRLGGSNYIVTAMSLETINLVLDQLRAGAKMQIRYADNDPDDPWVFIEPRDGPPIAANGFTLPEEESARFA